MITRLTDLTLRCLDVSEAPDETLREFYTLLFAVGADLVEVTTEIARRLGSALDPGRTVLHVGTPAEVLPGFARYSCRASDLPCTVPVLREVRVNDTREINLLARYGSECALRIVGLDDLFLQDFRRVLARLRHDLPPTVELSPTNGCGCASALLTEWLMEEGGNGAGSFAGAGGYAPLEETLIALRLTRKYQKRSDLSVLPRLTELYETLSGSSVGPHKPVLGREVFTVGSGVHVDGILKNSANYEPYPPELVGARRRIVVGRHAGRVSVLHVLRQLGYQPDEAGAEGLLPLVRRESARLRRELTEGELAELARREGVI